MDLSNLPPEVVRYLNIRNEKEHSEFYESLKDQHFHRNFVFYIKQAINFVKKCDIKLLPLFVNHYRTEIKETAKQRLEAG